MIVPLHKLSVSKDVANKELFESYIAPYVWEGEVTLDGGWGPKNEIQELTSDDPLTGFKYPFLIKPTNDLDPETFRESNKRYHIAFPGEQWPVLLNFISSVSQLGVENQRYILQSYFSTNIPNEGSKILRLNIKVDKESTTILIEQGKWIPSFENSLVVAGW